MRPIVYNVVYFFNNGRYGHNKKLCIIPEPIRDTYHCLDMYQKYDTIQALDHSRNEGFMEWQLLGYETYPFSVDPISAETLKLFTGHEQEASLCQSVLHDRTVRLIIEGARGVGTTSF